MGNFVNCSNHLILDSATTTSSIALLFRYGTVKRNAPIQYQGSAVAQVRVCKGNSSSHFDSNN